MMALWRWEGEREERERESGKKEEGEEKKRGREEERKEGGEREEGLLNAQTPDKYQPCSQGSVDSNIVEILTCLGATQQETTNVTVQLLIR